MKVQARSDIHDHAVDGRNHQRLIPGRVYDVLQLNDKEYRVINEGGEPILYPKALFTVVDPSIPDHWIRDEYEDGEYHIGPSEANAPGFYEDYFDGKPEAIDAFTRIKLREIVSGT